MKRMVEKKARIPLLSGWIKGGGHLPSPPLVGPLALGLKVLWAEIYAGLNIHPKIKEIKRNL